MRLLIVTLCCAAGLCAQTGAAAKPASSAPAKERLRYNISWATGLSLGEAELLVERIHTESLETLQLTFEGDAGIPGFPIKESAGASATSDLCSIRLAKKTARGGKRSEESVTFEQKQLKIVRQTAKGGQSETAVAPCARDALTYISYLRRELAQGRLPKTEKVIYGAAYEIAVRYVGAERVRIGDETIETDRLQLTVTGPAAKFALECSFARDAGRTPVQVRVPTANGVILVELMREAPAEPAP